MLFIGFELRHLEKSLKLIRAMKLAIKQKKIKKEATICVGTDNSCYLISEGKAWKLLDNRDYCLDETVPGKYGIFQEFPPGIDIDLLEKISSILDAYLENPWITKKNLEIEIETDRYSPDWGAYAIYEGDRYVVNEEGVLENQEFFNIRKALAVFKPAKEQYELALKKAGYVLYKEWGVYIHPEIQDLASEFITYNPLSIYRTPDKDSLSDFMGNLCREYKFEDEDEIPDFWFKYL